MPITRRTFMKTTGALAAGAVAAPLAGHGAFARDAADIPTPTKPRIEWQDSEFGVLFHLDMPVVAGDHTGNNATRKTFDPRQYNPKKLDTDQWVAAAKSAGARYAVFTATHFNGFMQWQSDLYPYGVKQAAWRDGKGDVVADFVESCYRYGIKPAIYFSTHRNAYHKVWGHYVDWGKGKGTPKQEKFNRIAEGMTRELCSCYGRILQIWYDAGVKLPHEGGPDVLPIFNDHQPNALFYNSTKRSDHRWIGNEAGHAGYPCWSTMPGEERGAISHNSGVWRDYLHGGDPDGSEWSPGMVDTVLRGKGGHTWFWRPDEEDLVHTVGELTEFYYQSVGRNCNLVLGVVVNNEGLVPEPDVKRLGEFGKELERRFSEPIADTYGRGDSVELELPKPTKIDHVSIMEDIRFGERTREYVLEGLKPGGEWRELSRGQSVGHKRIERFDATEVARVRFRATQAQATPHIRSLAAYYVG